MLNFQIVAYAPESPRDWWIYPPKGRDASEPVVRQLMGNKPLFRGARQLPTLVNDDLVGVSVWGPVVIVAWPGVSETAFNWSSLQRELGSQRFSLSVASVSRSMEARWEDADGRLVRHVAITDGKLTSNIGDAYLVDETADTDTSLQINHDNRLPAKTVATLLAGAKPHDVKTYDGRRYVRTNNRRLINEARIVHTDPQQRTWIAVDQTGTINTLFDPLAHPEDDLDPEDLAIQVANAWFRTDMTDDTDGPTVLTYAWPNSPSLEGLAATIRTVQADPQGFFTLLATATFNNVYDRVADKYGLHYRDAYDLLKEPLIHLLPHRPEEG